SSPSRQLRHVFFQLAASRLEHAVRVPLMRADSVACEPGLRIDCLIDIAVLHAGWIELEVQVRTKGTTSLTDVPDDLAGTNGLAGPHGHRGHVRRHRRHAICVL